MSKVYTRDFGVIEKATEWLKGVQKAYLKEFNRKISLDFSYSFLYGRDGKGKEIRFCYEVESPLQIKEQKWLENQ